MEWELLVANPGTGKGYGQLWEDSMHTHMCTQHTHACSRLCPHRCPPEASALSLACSRCPGFAPPQHVQVLPGGTSAAHVCVHGCTRDVYTGEHACVQVCTSSCVHTCGTACVHVETPVCAPLCVHVCKYTCVHVSTCVCPRVSVHV